MRIRDKSAAGRKKCRMMVIAVLLATVALSMSAFAGQWRQEDVYKRQGMASPLAVGKLARLAGADIVMINTPYGGYPLLHQKYMQTVAQLTLPFYDIKPSMPSIGGRCV